MLVNMAPPGLKWELILRNALEVRIGAVEKHLLQGIRRERHLERLEGGVKVLLFRVEVGDGEREVSGVTGICPLNGIYTRDLRRRHLRCTTGHSLRP